MTAGVPDRTGAAPGIAAGTVVAGYRVDEVVGQGASGVVHRVTHVTLGRTYALKLATGDDEAQYERFRAGIGGAAALSHPHAVAIYYAGEHEGRPFAVTDFVDGADLGTLIAREGPLEPQRAAALLGEIAEVVDAAHAAGLVHGGIKPSNVLIERRDGVEHVRVTDFAIAAPVEFKRDAGRTRRLGGSVDYMSPEQISGEPMSSRSDIYGLGCLLHLMLTGEPPFAQGNTLATAWAHLHAPRPTLGRAAFDEVIGRAMARDPVDRFATAGDLARAAAGAASAGEGYAGSATVVGRSLPPEAFGDEPPETTVSSVPGAPADPDATRIGSADETRYGTDAGLTRAAGADEETRYGADPGLEETRYGGDPDHTRAAASPDETRIGTDPGLTRVPSDPDATRIEATAAGASWTPSPDPDATRIGAGDDPAMTRAASGMSYPVAPPEGESTGTGHAVPPPGRRPAKPRRARRWVLAAIVAVLVLAAGAAASQIFSSEEKAAPPPGDPFDTSFQRIPTSKVTATGDAIVRLDGNTARIEVNVKGLLNEQHLMHIHTGGQGKCPPASAAKVYNGNRSISADDGGPFYGQPQVSLTERGDASRKSITSFNRFPEGANITYRRTIRVPAPVAAQVRSGLGVLVAHGIDFNRNSRYDAVLDPPGEDRKFTQESTSPAICGPLRAQKATNASAGTVFTAVLQIRESASQLFCTLGGATTAAVRGRGAVVVG
jgi:serine/threonine-protein kinase